MSSDPNTSKAKPSEGRREDTKFSLLTGYTDFVPDMDSLFGPDTQFTQYIVINRSDPRPADPRKSSRTKFGWDTFLASATRSRKSISAPGEEAKIRRAMQRLGEGHSQVLVLGGTDENPVADYYEMTSEESDWLKARYTRATQLSWATYDTIGKPEFPDVNFPPQDQAAWAPYLTTDFKQEPSEGSLSLQGVKEEKEEEKSPIRGIKQEGLSVRASIDSIPRFKQETGGWERMTSQTPGSSISNPIQSSQALLSPTSRKKDFDILSILTVTEPRGEVIVVERPQSFRRRPAPTRDSSDNR